MKRTLRVLNVEDSERDVALLRLHLSRAGYELIFGQVETSSAMKVALETREWDVVLSDYSMPTFNALAALKLLKEMKVDLPFIIISGTIGEEVAVAAMRAGAHDYLMKDNLLRLAPTIERELQEAKNRRARQGAEEALRESVRTKEESLALLDTLLSTAPVGFAFHNRDLVYERINESLAAINGLTVEQHLGHTLREVLPEMAAVVEPLLQRVLEWGKPVIDLELSGPRSAELGQQRYLLTSFYPVRMQGGETLGIGVLVSDITERKLAEQALRESEERYRLLFESNPHPMWVYDVVTLAFLAVNEAAIQHYGYSREEFLSMTIKEIRPQEDVPALLENVSLVSGGMDKAGIWKHRKKDGRIIDVEITSHGLAFAGKRAELVLVNDVTEGRRIEAMRLRRAAQVALRAEINTALAESDSSLRSILERFAEALVQHLEVAFARIWTLNRDENMLELQASAGQYTHIDGPHARVPVGTFKIGLIAQQRQPHITNDVQNDPLVSDKEWARREEMIAFAGYPLIVEDRLVGVMAMFARQMLPEDTLDSLAFVADLISQGIERKRAEEALHQSEERLRQSQKLEAIGLLAGGIAHDFNNLLTAINGYSDLTLRRLPADDPLRRNVEEIKKAGDRAASLTRQLLAFSRKQVLQPKVIDLNSVISELERMLGRLIGEDIELRAMLEPQLGHVKADPGQVEQVIMNLVINARDAMPQGGKLTIETENVSLGEEYAGEHIAVIPGRYVKLAVTDTGKGMDEEIRKRIFEPFFTTKELGKGTGLGLSTVYGIVKQSGGNIWVYSEVGRGTTFKIYLPRVDETTAGYKRSAVLQSALQGTETILLAEDEEIVRKLASQVLGMQGYQVLEAANGRAAVSICERHSGPIDLLLTDVIMPEMSGRDVADRLTQLRPEMKVLYMSGYTDNAIVHQGVLNEGANFIQKPFSPGALGQMVRQVLDERIE
jgi:two-component system cell cycle sensor histidine kinase/response regulator CckA